jgi:hypothetical protein
MKASLIVGVFVLSACSGASDDTALLTQRDATSAVADDSDPHGANCLTRRVSNPQENGSEVWVRSFDAEGAVAAEGVASDSAGNAYVTRADGGTLKFSASGELVWSKPYGVLVAVAANDDVILAGTFRDGIEIEGAALAGSGGSDVYVVRLAPSGTLERSVVLGTSGDDALSGLAATASGRAIVSGEGIGTVALEENGSVTWSRDLNGAIAVDPSDNVLVTGSFSGARDFGGGPLTSAGGRDIFLAKLDPEGAHLFSARFGDAGLNQDGQAIASDPLGNILVSGVFDGSVDFGTGALTLAGCPREVWCKTSGFVAKFDANGGALFGLARGPLRELRGIAADGNGNVVVSGATPGGVPSYRIPLLVVLNPEGDELWERAEWPLSGVGSGRTVAVDACGDLLWSLSVKPSLDSEEHAYLAKLTP